MNVLIVLAHPDRASFNHALAAAAAQASRHQGHAVVLHDLYAEAFDPMLPAAEFSRTARLEPSLRRCCDELADDAGVAPGPAVFSGVTLAQNVPSRAEVDRVLSCACAAGATLLRAASEKDWGGYSGYFADPDGHPWEIAYNPHFRLDARGWLVF